MKGLPPMANIRHSFDLYGRVRPRVIPNLATCSSTYTVSQQKFPADDDTRKYKIWRQISPQLEAKRSINVPNTLQLRFGSATSLRRTAQPRTATSVGHQDLTKPQFYFILRLGRYNMPLFRVLGHSVRAIPTKSSGGTC